jgi:hypothetical protein
MTRSDVAKLVWRNSAGYPQGVLLHPHTIRRSFADSGLGLTILDAANVDNFYKFASDSLHSRGNVLI